MPVRIQLHRTKGWKKPDGAVVVARPSRWGNPFRIGEDGDREQCVERYRAALWAGQLAFTVDDVRQELAGRDLACWCRPGDTCHADVLLEVANGQERLQLPGLVGLGTAPLGSSPDWSVTWAPIDRAHAAATVRAAIEAGVGWIDTAPFYGWGRAEEIVGEAIRGHRDEVVLLSKCGTWPADGGGSWEDHSRGAIRQDVEASLRRLRTDRLDVLQLHDPDPATPIEEAWATVAELMAEGKVRAAGLSNHPVELMDGALRVGPVDVVQHQYSLLHGAPRLDGVLPWCRAHGVPFLAWSPLASGFLVDGFDPDQLGADDFRRRSIWAAPGRRDRLLRLRAELGRIGEASGRDACQMAVGWLLAQPPVHVIVGARSPEEAAQLPSYRPLTSDEMDAVDAAVLAELGEDVASGGGRRP